MLAQRGLENNEMFLLKNQRPAKKISYSIDVPLVEGYTQVHYNLCFTPMALCVTLPSSDIVVLPPKSYITLLEYPIVLDFIFFQLHSLWAFNPFFP